MKNRLLPLVLILLFGVAGPGPAGLPPGSRSGSAAADPAPDDAMDRARAAARDAAAAYRDGDFSRAARRFGEAVSLRPHHPTLIYNLAATEARIGEDRAALALLRRLAAMGVALDPGGDPDFASLRGSTAFEEVSAALARNGDPVGESGTVLALSEPGFIPEGVAYDPVRDALFLGSVHRGRILRVHRGRPELFADGGDGLWCVMGMQVDPQRGLLWVCTSAAEFGAGVPEADRGRAALIAFDCASGRTVRRAEPPPAEEGHWFGDLCLSPAGDVYVTDSRTQEIWVLRHGAGSLERFLADPGFGSLQGLTPSGDGGALYVADYSRGIFRVDLATRDVRLLEYPLQATLLGVDGLARHGRDLIAVQNGIRPHRIVRAVLDPGGERIERVEVLARGDRRWDEPTLGFVRDDAFTYVADSHWNKFGEGGTLPDPDRLSGPTILRLRLP